MGIHGHKFLVDVSLHRLGHWLRTAGYDTAFAEPDSLHKDSLDSDYYLLQHALNESRLLLTSNPNISQLRRAQGTVFLITNTNIEQCVEELSSILTINWHFKPFTRCTACNTRLDLNDQEYPQNKSYCPGCKHIFWGASTSHNATRIRTQLDHWFHKHSA